MRGPKRHLPPGGVKPSVHQPALNSNNPVAARPLTTLLVRSSSDSTSRIRRAIGVMYAPGFTGLETRVTGSECSSTRDSLRGLTLAEGGEEGRFVARAVMNREEYAVGRRIGAGRRPSVVGLDCSTRSSTWTEESPSAEALEQYCSSSFIDASSGKSGLLLTTLSRDKGTSV